jgi:polysaccharide pyruvyl transferase WcaK-like protein
MKKVVIAGASVYGLNNLSDDSMLSVFCRELHRNIPNIQITLLARHPGPELDEFFNLKSIKNLDHNSREESRGRWYYGLNPGDPTDHLREIWNAIKESDLLIIGGEPFIDISLGLYRGPAPYASLLISLAKFLEKPIMINGIHIGRPLKTDLGKELARFCISNANLVTIREEQSRSLLQDMGIKTDNVVTLADTAYGLDPIEGKKRGLEVLKKEGILFKSDKVIGVTFRHMYWRWNESVWEHYSRTVADVCDYMIETFGVDVLLIPHNTYEIDDKYMDDRPAHNDIVAKMKNKEHAHQIRNRYNLFDTLSLFPLLEMIFSNRRHSLIFGAIHDVPGLGVGEELHIKVTMEELGIGGDKFVDIEELDPDAIKKNLTNIWNNRENIIVKEREVLPSLREKALMHAKLAVDLMT